MAISAPLTSCTQQKENKVAKLNKNSDLKGHKIVVVTGTSEDKYARKHLQSSIILETENTSDLVLNVKTRKAEIGLINYNIVKMFMMKYPEIGVVNDSMYSNPIGVAFSKQRTDLRDKFNVFLAQFKKSGGYDKLYHKWIDDFEHAKMPDIPNSGKNGVIKFQTEGTKAPFSFMGGNNQLAGFDIELVQRFAASVGMKLQTSVSGFSGLIEAASTGAADMAADCIFITPERAKKIAFSDQYFTCNACSFALKENIEGSVNEKKAEDKGILTSLSESFKQNFVEEGRYKMIGNGLMCTLEITIFSVIIGTILGGGICYLRMRKNKLCRNVADVYIQFFRGIPEVVMLMLLFYAIFASSNISGVTVSIIGFSLIFSSFVAEMYRTSIESISVGQSEAGLSMGFTNFQTFRYIVLPVMTRRMLPVYKGLIIAIIKSTSIVGYITVQDLTKVSDIIRSSTFDAFMPLILITIVYFLIIWLFSMLLKCVEIKFEPKESRFL
jgi:polar amino acid transport system substrate-binding protein